MDIHKVTRKARRIAAEFRLVRKMYAARSRKSVKILMYHGVVRSPLPVANWCHVQAGDFETQMQMLSESHTVMPVLDIVAALQNGDSLPDHCAAITFDDGYMNNATVAHPILEKFNLPYSVFLVSSTVGSRSLTWIDDLFCRVCDTGRDQVDFEGASYELTGEENRRKAYREIATRLKEADKARKDQLLVQLNEQLGLASGDTKNKLMSLDWDSVDQMKSSGLASFGAHTHSHQILAKCDLSSQRSEIRQSRDIICEHLGSCDQFAYPNGRAQDFTPETRALVVEQGFKCAFTTIEGLVQRGDDLFTLKRIPVGADTSLREFEIGLLGL